MIAADNISLLNYLVGKYQYASYLEIGCRGDECFNAVRCATKIGVDPVAGGTIRMTSDSYFAQLSPLVRFDLVFIDGLHHCEQVDRDIANALQHLTSGGTIVLHDCKPTSEEEATYPMPVTAYNWTGDVWRAIALWRTKLTVDICVVDFDWGCGVIRVRPNSAPWEMPAGSPDYQLLPFSLFQDQCPALLNLKSFPEFERWLE